ncbi:MAG: flagellar export protein FliJ [Candidatus Sedimenticola endophacoides]|uniref:Flagellar FliJ protein n=1 Tax=Candidatus Sedimenticola endophacoides TaxID=2548426 RepID=A0A657PY65_9GAMM|nr:MAG: flagellar export protein FliJ [Candidatus Sedimenticola endophacoides]OQX33104.1 MAG: flagellar export protein FliJ [Candidatus Sedimenticola endophacoides]OQX42435.1 MAG: flagellar export protein FliJ [Candidatus Sedimenticola endophacoides]OQX44275.1 MAG: flagellar export protein FliJ [Candidatus Sedimenticola endophacoides]OQX44659.1 MAG: flagellar export protein FliJ [Candidatus Sedimenticola endophacoides]
MVKSKRFQPVRRVAESRERNAARELGDAKRWVQLQEEKLRELRDYHLEYLQRFQEAARAGMSASQLLEYRAFIEKLERAIGEQEEAVAEGQRRCELNREQWLEKHRRHQVIGKVVERVESAEGKVEQVREQKATDELNLHPGRK